MGAIEPVHVRILVRSCGLFSTHLANENNAIKPMQLSLYGNNKGTLYAWGEFLTYHHTFGKSHKVVDIRLKPDATTKYELLIDGCTEQSIKWMSANFDPLKPPQKSVSEFKRLPKTIKIEPIWIVNKNMEVINYFSGSEENARKAFIKLQSHRLTWLIILKCPELEIEEKWEKARQTVR
jgi:hypothetical protein